MSMVALFIYKVAMFVDENQKDPKPEHPPEEVAKLSLSLYISFGYYILVFLYNLVINLLLVIGVHKVRINETNTYLLTFIVSSLAISNMF